MNCFKHYIGFEIKSLKGWDLKNGLKNDRKHGKCIQITHDSDDNDDDENEEENVYVYMWATIHAYTHGADRTEWVAQATEMIVKSACVSQRERKPTEKRK